MAKSQNSAEGSPRSSGEKHEADDSTKDTSAGKQPNSDQNVDGARAADASDETGGQWISGIRLWLTMAALGVACLLLLLDMTIIVTVRCRRALQNPGRRLLIIPSTQAIPRITDEFHSLADIAWYGSAYQLSAFVPLALYLQGFKMY
jgi:hypothetical protein